MSLQSVVKEAENPKVALEAIARYLDHLNTKIDAVLKLAATSPPDDGWGEWDDHDTHTKVNADFSRQAEIEEVKEALKSATGDDVAALNARLRLLQDTGESVEVGYFTEGKRSQIEVGDDKTMITLHDPTETQLEIREEVADKLREAKALDDELIDSYIKGGPLVLYHTDRDFVLSLPYDWRRAFIEDIEINSPAEANEVARDILKSTDAEGTRDIQLDHQSRQR